MLDIQHFPSIPRWENSPSFIVAFRVSIYSCSETLRWLTYPYQECSADVHYGVSHLANFSALLPSFRVVSIYYCSETLR